MLKRIFSGKQSHLRKSNIKIIPFVLVSQVGSTIPSTERLIADYLSQGWRIVAAGGAGGDPGESSDAWANGFIILQRDHHL